MQIVKLQQILKQNQIHLSNGEQLTTVGFESPLQQVLQQQKLLLRLLGKQNRWQLWLSSRPMLKRSWFQQTGLSESKIIQISHIQPEKMIHVIEKALITGTASYVVACVGDLSDNDKYRLQIAAKASGSHLFLVNDNYDNSHDFMTMSKKVQVKLH